MSYDRRTAAHGTPAERIAAAIDQIDRLPNAYSAWIDAHNGDKALAKVNSNRVEGAVDLLGAVLASMPKAVSYVVVGLPTGVMQFKDSDSLIAKMKTFGIRHTGYHETYGRQRPELESQPKFDNLLGPMYDGPGKVRYETLEAYEQLSR
jgi:hypothetical protein